MQAADHLLSRVCVCSASKTILLKPQLCGTLWWPPPELQTASRPSDVTLVSSPPCRGCTFTSAPLFLLSMMGRTGRLTQRSIMWMKDKDMHLTAEEMISERSSAIHIRVCTHTPKCTHAYNHIILSKMSMGSFWLQNEKVCAHKTPPYAQTHVPEPTLGKQPNAMPPTGFQVLYIFFPC